MRLLFIDNNLPHLLRDGESPVGGWAVQLKVLLTALTDAGHRSGVLTFKGTNAYVGAQSVCDLLETYNPDRGIKKLRLFYYWIPSMLAAARTYKPDVIVQSCSGLDTGLMAFIARRLGVPFVLRIAADSDTDERRNSYLTKVERVSFRYGLQAASLVICQNGYQSARMERAYPGKPLLLLKNGIQAPFISLPDHSSRSYVAWVGGFRYQKNLALLERIARELPSVEFRVAGVLPALPDPETANAVSALSRRPNVKLVGYVRRADIFEFLSGARVLLSTSRFEGFSNTFLEAFACGTPVVAPAAVDPDSMIATNKLGLASQDESQLAGLVHQICDMDEAAFNDLSHRCRDYVETHHSAKATAEKLVTALESIIASDRGNGAISGRQLADGAI